MIDSVGLFGHRWVDLVFSFLSWGKERVERLLMHLLGWDGMNGGGADQAGISFLLINSSIMLALLLMARSLVG